MPLPCRAVVLRLGWERPTLPFWQSKPLSLTQLNSTMSEPAFKLSRPPNAPISDEELIADLRRVSELLATDKVTQDQYNSHGEYHCTTQERRFGSWNEALLRSGLAISNRMNISDEVLFENVLNIWQHYGRQPRRSELASDPSHISEGPYKRASVRG